jgi:hypothetical protein
MATSRRPQGIRYRVRETESEKDGGMIWYIEYKQNPADDDWSFRGKFIEKDGRFSFAGRWFESTAEVLRYRIAH